MGRALEQVEAGEILEEIARIGEDHPEESRRLVEALMRLWAAPSVPEKVEIIRQTQEILEGLRRRHSEVNRMKDLLDRYERANRELEAVRHELTAANEQLTALGRELESREVATLTERPSRVLEELWDNEADAVYDDL